MMTLTTCARHVSCDDHRSVPVAQQRCARPCCERSERLQSSKCTAAPLTSTVILLQSETPVLSRHIGCRAPVREHKEGTVLRAIRPSIPSAVLTTDKRITTTDSKLCAGLCPPGESAWLFC